MGRFSFLLAAVKGLKKKKKVRSKAADFERRKKAMVKPDSKPISFDDIPEDLLMKILAKLPAKHVTRLMGVSQLWYSLIASSYFTKLFLESPASARRPRMLMSLVDKADKRHYKFLSSSSTHDDPSDTSVCVLDQVLNMPGLGGDFVNPLRGLICVRLGRSLRIFNLTTRQRVTLPIIRSRLVTEANDNIWNFFLHDPVHDEYKVLSTVWEVSEDEGRVVRSEHQVLVLGPAASWRNTQGRIYPHRPYSRGIPLNVDDVMYYAAWIDKNISVVISFDSASEDFNMIELPIEAGIIWHANRASLMNYGGKLAVFECSRLPSDGSVDMWVMEDVGKWSKKTLVLPLSLMNFVHGDEFSVVGTNHRSLVMLVKTMVIPTEPRPFVHYDLETNKIIRRTELSPLPRLGFFGFSMQMALWQDDIENIMYLET
ncbi:F-box associated domain type 3 [Arabidopsis thaliana x Arabidopsis arenosa]|uniref:F-box associated domain type 3 n=1 Tax=Arabidopsis thaliana x Arabidopsis arenosa TaxID=1240361 RepID=A0A8T1Y8E4_9BRAS|nr:F-box associated domain type 3 [Arabidopsis thaliana x Arabidopsis arenosa]